MIRSLAALYCDFPDCPAHFVNTTAEPIDKAPESEGWMVGLKSVSGLTFMDYCPNHRPIPKKGGKP